MPDPNLSLLKQQLVAEAAARKKSTLDPDWNEYSNLPTTAEVVADMGVRAEAAEAARERTGDELARDVPLAMGRTTATLVGGSLGLAQELSRNVGPGALLQRAAENGELGETLQDNARAARVRLQEGLAGGTNRIDQALARRMSQVSQLNEAQVAAETAADEAANLARYEAAVAGGDNRFLAGARRLGSDFVDAAGNTLGNPTAASNLIIGQVPTLGIGLGAKAAVTGEQVAARAAQLAAKEGLETASSQLRQEAARQLATRNLMLGVGGSEGGGAYQQAAGEVLATPIADLIEQYPDYAERLRTAVDPDAVRAEIASRVGLTAAAIQAPLAGATSRLAARFELNPLASGADEAASAGQRLASATANIGQESAEETLQSGGGQLAGNLAQAATGRADVDLLAGVGGAGGQGFAGGAGMAGAFQAPAVAGAVARIPLDTLRERAQAVRTENQAPVEQQAAEQHARRTELAAGVETSLEEAGVPLPQSSLLDAVGGESSLGRVTGLSQVLEALRTNRETADDPRKGLQLAYVAKTARELRATAADLTTRLEQEPDPEAKTRLESLQLAIHALANNEQVSEAEAAFQQYPVEQVDALFAQLPTADQLSDTAADAEVLQTVELIREFTYAAPDKLAPAQIERALPLFQQLRQQGVVSAQDVQQLELAREVGQVREDYDAQAATLKQRYPKLKAGNVVQSEIRDDGFQLGGQHLRSINQHVAAVTGALGSGDTQLAALELGKFAQFATHMADKAAAFDAAARAQLDAGKEDRWFPVAGFKRLASATGLSQQDHEVNLHVEGSRGNIDWVFTDANAVTRAYNALAKAHPELIALTAQDQAPLPDRVLLESPVPTWTRHTPAVTPAAAAAAPAPDRQTSTTSLAPAEAPVAAPAPEPAPAPTGAADASAPDSAPVAGPVAAVQDAPASESSSGSAEAAASQPTQEEPVMPEAASEGAPALSVDFGSDARAPREELVAALELPDQAYLKAVNPSGKVTELPSDEAIDAELDDVEPAARAVTIGTHGEVTLKADGDYLYAVRGDDTVGLLVHKADGSTLMVRSSERGKGLGAALMRELLVRKPLAASNGLSAGAQATRLAALRALREEHLPSMSKQFPTLADLPVAEDAAPVARLQARNQWLQGFLLNARHRGLAGKGGLAALQEALATGKVRAANAALQALLPEDAPALALTTEELQALRTIATELVPELQAALDAQLQAVAAKDPRLLNGDPALWQFDDKLSLHATNFGRTDASTPLAYDPAIAEGLALATALWMMETLNRVPPHDDGFIATFLGKPEEAVTGLERGVFQRGTVHDALVTELARLLPAVLGLQANPDAPSTTHDGVAQALASDALNVLLDKQILVREEHFLAPDPAAPAGKRIVGRDELAQLKAQKVAISQFNTLRFAKDKTTPTVLQGLRAQLGGLGTRALSALLDPDREQEWRLGAPHAQNERTVRGSRQKLAPQQKTVLANHNAVAYHRNTQFVQWLLQLGKEPALKLFGYVEGDLEHYNAVDRVRVEGINLGLVQAWDALVEWNTQLEREATARGVVPEELPTHFAHYLTSNNRVMMEGAVNPQSNKLLREALVATRATMELGNPEHETALRLMVGQALGIKVENARHHAEVAAKVEAQLAEGGTLYPVWTAFADPDLPADVLFGLMESAGFARDGSAAKAFHALQAWAAYDQARTRGDATVPIHLAFEQDGKTDGPANAMAQLGLHTPSEVLFDNLARAGYFFNRGATTLGDIANDQGDLYGAVAGGMRALITEKLLALRERVTSDKVSAGAKATARAQGEGLGAAMRLFAALGQVQNLDPETATGRDLLEASFGRGFAKGPVTSTGYAGGLAAMGNALTKQVLESFYARLSENIQSREPLPQWLQDSINALVTTELVWRRTQDGTRYLVAERVGGPLPLHDLGRYHQLKLSARQQRAMASHLREGFGRMLRASITQQMGSTLEGMATLVAAATVQTTVLEHQFEQAYRKQLDQLIADGQLLPGQSLSRNQEQALLRELRPLAPITQFATTAGMGSREYGLNMAQTDRAATLADAKGKPRTVKSIAGGLVTKLTKLGFKDPGVRAAALSIISAGDATMMAGYFQKARQALDVWDGLEVGLTDLFTAGREINQAVYDGWKFNLLRGIHSQFVDALPAIREALQDPELVAKLAAALRLTDTQTVDSFLEDLVSELGNKADRIDATKEVLDELGLSIDHMAGARRPFVKDGRVLPREELLAHVLTQIEQKLAARQVAHIAAPDPVLWHRGAREVTSRHDRAGVIALMDARLAESGNKVQRFVWTQIKPLLPAGLVVHHGDAAAMRAKILEVLPDAQLPATMAAGAYYGEQVFLTNNSTETLLHELVHAAVTGLIDRAYAGGRGLTAHQRDAVRQLETLAGEFLMLDPARVDLRTATALGNAQATVEALLDRNDVAGAVNEFLAWTLGNRQLAVHLQTLPAPKGLKALAKKVLGQVRKLLGLPGNGQVESFLEQTLGQFVRLTRVGTAFEETDGRILFQLLGEQEDGTAGNHALHLQAVHEQVQAVLQTLPPQDPVARDALIAFGRQQADAVLDAGFPLSAQERLVFEQVQAMLASSLQLDPRVMTALEHLRQAAADQVRPNDFPGLGQYEAVFGNRARTTDLQGRSTLLANFMALGLVYAPLRARLAQLELPKAPAAEKTADAQLRGWMTRLFDRLGDLSVGVQPHQSQRAILDQLMARLAVTQRQAARRARTQPSRFERLEAGVKSVLATQGERAGATLAARHAAGKQGGVDGLINLALNGIRALTNEDAAQDFGEDVLAVSNSAFRELRDLIAELVGGTSVNRPIHELLNQARSQVAQVRQRLRDEAPQQVRQLFTKPLDEATWAGLVRWVGKTDLQSLLGHYTANQVQAMLEEPAQLTTTIGTLEQQVQQLPNARAEWLRGADNLAHYLIQGEQLAGHGPLYRNAAALARLAGFGKAVTAEAAAQAEPLLDQLVTLKALQQLERGEQQRLAELLRDERAGMDGLVRLLRRRVRREQGKHRATEQRLNQWKGYVPVARDPRRELVLAGPQRGAELVRQGYELVESYQGDAADPSQGLAYYALTAAGGRVTYNQGALQTVEGSVMGVDHITGRTLDPAVKTLIKDPKVVAQITALKRRGVGGGSAQDLLPVFDANGTVVAYERALSKRLLDRHLRAKPDLAQSIGMWMGRQAEEEIARAFNGRVVGVLKQIWDTAEQRGKTKDFVDITDPKAPATLRDTWNTIPRETQSMLLQEFDGAVMVRKDMLNNALGYRSASIGDAFTGMTDLPEDLRAAIETAAYGLLGKGAYQKLVVAERALQGLVGTVKDVIVVRSGVVALANIVSNLFQLTMHGLSPLQLPRILAQKSAETETYLRNAHRVARIQVELETTTNPVKRGQLERERQNLHDLNRRLSIWPLIEKGELPAIAEGLTEQDEFSLLSDGMAWLEEKAKHFPPGVVTAAKYALISKDTALYQGMNRLIQFGDFTAKAALYDHMVQQQGLSAEQALSRISERFVNYNLLAGRSRDYLENMGLTWFMQYKLRMQKVVLSTLRENPLRFLLAGAGADWLGADSLLSTSAPLAHWDAATGPGQFFRADDALLWRQLGF